MGDAWISLGRGNRRDFVNGLRSGGDENMSNKVGGVQKGRLIKETTGKGGAF